MVGQELEGQEGARESQVFCCIEAVLLEHEMSHCHNPPKIPSAMTQPLFHAVKCAECILMHPEQAEVSGANRKQD